MSINDEIGSVSVAIDADASGLIDAASSAHTVIDSLNEAVINLKKQTTEITAPAFFQKFKNDFFNWDKALFTHTAKTSHMSVEEQLSWWQEALNTYSYDYYAVMECEENIYELSRKLVENVNDLSELYISQRNHINDWESFGDSAVSAFERFKESNRSFAEEGIISWGEYYSNVSSLGEKMYAERVQQSREWLSQQYKYNDLSIDDYIAGLERMTRYTEEYYDAGIISYSTFLDGKRRLSNVRAELTDLKNERIYKSWQSSASGYMEQREVYDDWEKYEDSEVQFYERCIERQREFFEQGIIDWDTYNRAVIGYSMDLYKAKYNEFEEIIDGILSEQQNYIALVEKQFDKEISEYDSEWKIMNFRKDIAEANAMERIYRNAVTQKGKHRYNEYVERIDELGYEQTMYMKNLEKEQQIAALKEQYAITEKEKTQILRDLTDGNFDLSQITASIGEGAAAYEGDIKNLLTQILSALTKRNLEMSKSTTTYNISGVDTNVLESFLTRATGSLSFALD